MAKNEVAIKLSDSLEEPLELLVKQARSLEGRVVQAGDLKLLIALLEGLNAAAQFGCGVQTWHRKFTLKDETKVKKASRKK